MIDDDEGRFTELLDASSLGTPAARRLRSRVPKNEAEAVRRVGELRAQVKDGRTSALLDLADVLAIIGDRDGADFGYRTVAAEALLRLAALHDRTGDAAGARLWRERAQTLRSPDDASYLQQG